MEVVRERYGEKLMLMLFGLGAAARSYLSSKDENETHLACTLDHGSSTNPSKINRTNSMTINRLTSLIKRLNYRFWWILQDAKVRFDSFVSNGKFIWPSKLSKSKIKCIPCSRMVFFGHFPTNKRQLVEKLRLQWANQCGTATTNWPNNLQFELQTNARRYFCTI